METAKRQPAPIPAAKTIPADIGSIRAIRDSFNGGSRDVYRDGVHIATVWDYDSTRPTALFTETGRVSEKEGQEVMESLQCRYSGRLRFVKSPKKWLVKCNVAGVAK